MSLMLNFCLAAVTTAATGLQPWYASRSTCRYQSILTTCRDMLFSNAPASLVMLCILPSRLSVLETYLVFTLRPRGAEAMSLILPHRARVQRPPDSSLYSPNPKHVSPSAFLLSLLTLLQLLNTSH
jgi:hypothetical protein